MQADFAADGACPGCQGPTADFCSKFDTKLIKILLAVTVSPPSILLNPLDFTPRPCASCASSAQNKLSKNVSCCAGPRYGLPHGDSCDFQSHGAPQGGAGQRHAARQQGGTGTGGGHTTAGPPQRQGGPEDPFGSTHGGGSPALADVP